MDLDLKINGVELQPGGPVNASLLLENGFRKPGILERLVKRPAGGGEIFLAENCETDCFGDAFNLYPCNHGYLNRDCRWQTEAIVQVVDGTVRRITFHVLDGLYAAPNYMSRFAALCTRHLGEPNRGQAGDLIWRNDRLALSGRLHSDHIRADFSVEVQE